MSGIDLPAGRPSWCQDDPVGSRAPGLEEFDPSLFKNWSFAQERIKLQFRAEFFNLFNHANFQMGRTTVLDGSGKAIPTAPLILPPTLTSAREIQFGLKLSW